MLAKLAWRNIWRNKRRSIVILTSVVIGVIASVFMDSLSAGMIYQMLDNSINMGVGHIQIHRVGFRENKTIQNFIPDYKQVEEQLKKDPSVKSYSKRVVAFGLLSSATNSSGIYINGIVPSMEENVTSIKKSIVEGRYLSGAFHEIIISKLLAEKLNVGIGDKVVAMSNTPKGDIGSDLFRIVGIFESVSSEFDKANIFIPMDNAQQMLGIGDKVYEFAIMINNFENVDTVTKRLAGELPKADEVLSYKEILPMLVYQMDLYKQTSFITNLIIGLALIFGIVNTMLMAVFERIREFGVLMSIGMKNSKLFMMIILEALALGLIGTIGGLIISAAVELPLIHSGINFSFFAESLKSFGVGAIIYPQLSLEYTLITLFMIPAIAIIGAIYPAIKAIRLEPVSAVRYV